MTTCSARAGEYAPATVNRMISAVRGVLREAWLLAFMRADDYQKARAVKLVTASSDEPAGRSVAPSELKKLFGTCDDTPAGNRAAVMLALMYGCGLRRAEVVSIDLADYNRGDNAVKVRRGKGRKKRTAHLPVGARRAIDAWIACRGRAPGPLVCPVNKASRIVVRRLAPSAVWHAVRLLAERAGVAKVTPHDFRRTRG